MDWYEVLETTFLVMFWVGLVLTVVMAVLSGAFEHELGSGTSFEGGSAADLGGPNLDVGHGGELAPGHAEVGWSEGAVPGFSPWSPTVLCAALTGIGGAGYLCLVEWDMSPGTSLGLALLAGLALGGFVFGVLAWLFAKVQATSHVIAAATVGRTATVTTAISSGSAGAIGFVASGSRLVVPARCEDAANVPEGAEVEIVSVDGALYVVKETRESWLRRSRQGAGLTGQGGPSRGSSRGES